MNSGLLRAIASMRWQFLLVFLIYVLSVWFTTSLNIGDTPVYVDAILRVLGGGSTRFWDEGGFLSFWEFGHLLWRPLGWLSFNLLEPLMSGIDRRAGVTLTLLVINWVFGLLAVFSLYALVFQLTQKSWAAFAAATAFIFSNAFLNYVQSGCSYVPGLGLLLFGLYLMVNAGAETRPSRWKAIVAGAALAGSIGMWFPFFCAIPAALASPLILIGFTRTLLRNVIMATLTTALVTIFIYVVAISALGLGSISDVRRWAASSSHSVTENRGATRIVFGIPRSLINMGTDSVFFKRFLTRDTYNPVGLFDLGRRSLWKIGFAYLFLLALLLGLYTSTRGRTVLVLFLVNAVPVVVFAFLFAGGVLERYLPMFPMIFVSFGYCLGAKETNEWIRRIVVAFMIVASVVNGIALSNPVVDAEKEATLARVRDLFSLVNENTRIYVPPQDQLWGSAGRLKFEQQIANNFHVDPVAILGTASVPQWRSDFVRQTLMAWDQKQDVWISRRFLSRSPKSEWNWTEGEDKRITWAELNEFFAPLETTSSVGGEDGFLLLSPTENNKRLLGGYAN
ncbi:MAG TPA: hypothetical protein VFD48_10640 [Pyrinomonadaceae bacterium]|nr:hypothetical protein [Pyrinomonadaceae bacterium]